MPNKKAISSRQVKKQLREQMEQLLSSFLQRDVDLAEHSADLDVFLHALDGGDLPANGADQEDTPNILLERSPHPKNTLNELDGKHWMWFTKTILRTSYPSILGHELRRKQGGNKPPQLMQGLIEFFTKPGQLVLDPFAGAGGTLLGAQICGRRAIGIEINPASKKIYLAVCKKEKLDPQPMRLGDCRQILDTLEAESVDFIATDPPYSIRLEQTMSGDKANSAYSRQNRKSGYVQYSDNPRDLSNLKSFDAFYLAMRKVGEKLLRVLRPGGYAAVILRDAYQDSEYKMAAFQIASDWQSVGWVLKGDKIWYATGARMRPYGYPYVYVPNIVHQHILFFRKEKRVNNPHARPPVHRK
jgi:DNA modification methylase